MIGNAIVYVTIWLSMLAWFVGALSRAQSDALCDQSNQTDRDRVLRLEILYRRIWLAGSCLMCAHILAAYGVVHDWSHQAALEATAQESEIVTGIRAPWGVYVNLLFASVWFCYSLAMEIRGKRLSLLDSMIFWFLAFVVFAATVVFETGVIRIASIAGFTALVIQMLRGVRSRRRRREA